MADGTKNPADPYRNLTNAELERRLWDSPSPVIRALVERIVTPPPHAFVKRALCPCCSSYLTASVDYEAQDVKLTTRS